jgi:hypothetical protein
MDLRPHLAADGKLYNFEHFECFDIKRNHVSRYKEWKANATLCEIKKDGRTFELKNNPKQDQIDILLSVSEKSLVGKGKETVMDEKVRKSFEIKNDLIDQKLSTIKPSEKFTRLLDRELKKLKKSIGIIGETEMILHKITIYEKDSFFDTHIDAEHEKNQIATLSVELYTEYSGGELVVANNKIPSAKPECLQLTLFFIDVPHKINKLVEGYRISIQFDIIQKSVHSEFICVINDNIKLGIDKLKEHNVRRIGIPLNHLYFLNDENKNDEKNKGDNIVNSKNICLKGKDSQIYNSLLPYTSKIEICGIVMKDEKIYREEVMNIFKIDFAFEALYRESYDTKSKTFNRDVEINKKSGKIRYDSYDKINLDYREDKNSDFKMIKDEYLLGDCVFLNTKFNYKELYEGISNTDYYGEVSLGNHGFTGTITNNLAIIATLK